ncbi:hypothetical protein ACFOKI_01465 [Sphingomonas qilianensis]|uniref:Uncharacterized protein n=1 Tax=Sphingomonas qilianensis TaxID=1736690 RepID=A0ABU9XSC2_9SPHN
MNIKITSAVLLATTTLPGCATTYSMTPLAEAGQTVRYDQGRATTDQIKRLGSVKVTPVSVAGDGRLVFAVAALNTSGQAVTFGTENITVMDGAGTPVRVFTHDALVRQAKNRATWAAIAVAMVGASAAVAANQNAYRTANGSMTTPGGRVYRYTAQTYDPTAAALGTAAATAGTTAGMIGIRNTLNATLAGLNEEMLQTTTIDSSTAWGGKVVAAKLPGKNWPRDVTVTVAWQGETYPFRFRVAREQ